MRSLCFALFFLFFALSFANDFEKYRPLREQCARTPSNSECLKLKSKFVQLIEKCEKINTPNQAKICEQVKAKLCAIFPSTCVRATTIQTIPTTRRRTKVKSKPTKTLITTTTTRTSQTLTNEEFVQVPVNPEELRIRGEYCIRHGKEKKCQQLLKNLKSTYSSCNKKKPQPTKPEQIDCHSFQTHLCKAFPKFPPCIKKPRTST